MAYQPIQLPTPNGMGQAIDLFQRIRAAKQAQEYQRQQLAIQQQAETRLAANADRQFELNKQAQDRQDKRLDLETQWKKNAEDRAQREEFDKAVAEHERLTRAGLPLAGQRHLLSRGIRIAPDGTPINPFQPQAQQPTGAAPAAPPQQPPQGGSPVPDQIEFPQQQGSTGPVPQDVYDQTVTFANKTQNPETHTLDEYYRPGGPPPIVDPSAPQQPQPQMSVMDALRSGNLDNLPQSEPALPESAPTPQPTNPIFVASQAQNAARAQRFRMTGPQGQDLGVYDPGEYQQAAQLKAQEFAQQFQGVPEVQQYVPIVSGLIAGGHVEPSKAGELMLGLMQKDKALEQAKALREQFGISREDRLKMAANRDAALRAQAGAGNAFKADAGNTRDMAEFLREAKDFKSEVGFAKLLQNEQTLRSAMANAGAPNLLGPKDAQIALARFYRGAMPTEGEMHMLYSNMGGLANRIPKFWERLTSGGLTKLEIQQVQSAVNLAHEEWQKSVENAFEDAKLRWGPGSGFEAFAGNINTRVRGMFKSLGVDVPDIYPNPQSTVQLGSGQRPTVFQKARDEERKKGTKRSKAVKGESDGGLGALEEATQ